jgi:hypothetical protein
MAAGVFLEKHDGQAADVRTVSEPEQVVCPGGCDTVRRFGYEGVAEHSLTHDPYEATWAGPGFDGPAVLDLDDCVPDEQIADEYAGGLDVEEEMEAEA